MQSAECRVQSETKRPALLDARLLNFSVRILRLSAALPKTEEAVHIRRQILRSGTSAGANYQEACGAESRPDFVHKMQIVLKELRETTYWLRIVAGLDLLPQDRLQETLKESNELTAMIVKSLVTARGNAHGRD